MKTIIGLSGWAGSGKDTVADILVRENGFMKIPFAEPLRDFLYAQDPAVRMDGQSEYWSLSRVVDEYGWEGYKNSPFSGNLRALIQRTGTEAGRKTISQSIWIDAAVSRAGKFGRVVFSDVRFLNEASAVRSLGGDLWRIDRPGVGPANDHASEMELNDYRFDHRLQNDSSVEELVGRISHLLVD